MGLSDIFNSSKIKEENERLKQLMTPEMQNAINLQNHISELNNQISKLQNETSKLTAEISKQMSKKQH